MKLMSSLSMDDAIFLGLLKEKNLLPGNLKGKIDAEKTSADKAALFLNKVIDRAIDIGEFEPLNELLTVMSNEEYLKDPLLKQLANNIKQKLDNESSLIAMNSTGQ